MFNLIIAHQKWINFLAHLVSFSSKPVPRNCKMPYCAITLPVAVFYHPLLICHVQVNAVEHFQWECLTLVPQPLMPQRLTNVEISQLFPWFPLKFKWLPKAQGMPAAMVTKMSTAILRHLTATWEPGFMGEFHNMDNGMFESHYKKSSVMNKRCSLAMNYSL